MKFKELYQIRSHRLCLSFLALTFALCYARTIGGIVHVWAMDGDYSYGFFIPAITLYLIWDRKKTIASTRVSTFRPGGIAVLFFLMTSVYGILGSSPSAVRPSIPLIIISITLFCFGMDALKVFAFPLAFLIFMIPLPTIVNAQLTSPLQFISTKLGEMILRLCGISVFVQGNIIDLGLTQLQVVEACNGLRYVIPLLALGVLFAYFFEKSILKRIVIAASAIPISILTNGLRIGVTGILTQYYGPKLAEGFFHGFSGWLIFMFAVVLLVFLHLLMKNKSSDKISNQASSKHKPAMGKKQATPYTIIPMILTSIGMLAVFVLSYSTMELPRIGLTGGLSKFPLDFGIWHGRHDPIDMEMVKASGAEEALNITYNDDEGNAISLYIGYRSSAFGETENFFHSPDICLPSTGWKTIENKKHKIDGVPRYGTIYVQEMLIERMGIRQLVYYWFQTKSRISHNVNINRFHLTLHALQHDGTYDIFVRPVMLLKKGETITEDRKRLDGFVRDLMRTLLTFVRNNQYSMDKTRLKSISGSF